MHYNGGSLEFKSDNWLLCSVYRPRIRPSPLPSGVWSKITAADLAEVLLAATRIERRRPHVITVPHTDKWEHIDRWHKHTLIKRCRHFGVKQRRLECFCFHQKTLCRWTSVSNMISRLLIGLCTAVLSSDWLRVITWPGYWALIGWLRPRLVLSWVVDCYKWFPWPGKWAQNIWQNISLTYCF